MEQNFRDEALSIGKRLDKPLLLIAISFLQYLQEDAENPKLTDDDQRECDQSNK